MDALEAIRQTFFEECDERLAELERGLLAMEEGDGGPEIVDAVLRAVHSIKGGAGAFGVTQLVRFSHAFESALDALRSGRIAPDVGCLPLFLRAADRLADLVGAARAGAQLDPAWTCGLEAELAALTAAKPRNWRVHLRPFDSLYANGNDAVVLLRELSRLGDAQVTLDDSSLPPLDELDPEAAYLAWTIDLSTDRSGADIREVFEFVEAECDLEITPAPTASAGGSAPALADAGRVRAEAPPVPTHTDVVPRATSLRVDLQRLDRMIDLVGELVINQAALAQRVAEAGLSRSPDVASSLDELEHLTRDIQDSVMAIRAQPVTAVFQRLPRLAREVAALTRKEIRLITEGETTEVDNTIIERLIDPLTHMIRNAIDHGIETPAERVAAGKPREGTIRVAALQRSGWIVIEVTDDGAGIDRARVLEGAVAKGLVPAGAVVTDEEIDNLIFAPGFSTACAVSDISGRGVGMDVVRRSIQSLGGRISIASEPGRGCTFSLTLPLTLAVLDGMVVDVEESRFVIPLSVILETFQPRAVRTHRLGRGLQMVAIRGSYVPLIDVGAALGFRDRAPDPTAMVALLVETEEGARAALLVDDIHGQRQVVIKSLEVNYRQVSGIAAATIMGDGRVALILDVAAIIGTPAGAGDIPVEAASELIQ